MDDMYAGWHLSYDGITTPEGSKKLSEAEFLEQLFLEISEALGMEVLQAPAFEKLPGDPEKADTKEGVAGTCVFTTSHLFIHTWPLHHRFSFDLYSSIKFDQQSVEDALKNGLCVVRRSSRWTVRNWP